MTLHPKDPNARPEDVYRLAGVVKLRQRWVGTWREQTGPFEYGGYAERAVYCGPFLLTVRRAADYWRLCLSWTRRWPR